MLQHSLALPSTARPQFLHPRKHHRTLLQTTAMPIDWPTAISWARICLLRNALRLQQHLSLMHRGSHERELAIIGSGPPACAWHAASQREDPAGPACKPRSSQAPAPVLVLVQGGQQVGGVETRRRCCSQRDEPARPGQVRERVGQRQHADAHNRRHGVERRVPPAPMWGPACEGQQGKSRQRMGGEGVVSLLQDRGVVPA